METLAAILIIGGGIAGVLSLVGFIVFLTDREYGGAFLWGCSLVGSIGIFALGVDTTNTQRNTKLANNPQWVEQCRSIIATAGTLSDSITRLEKTVINGFSCSTIIKKGHEPHDSKIVIDGVGVTP